MTVIFSLLKWGAFSSQVNLPEISSECNSVIPGFSPVENGAPFHRRMPTLVYTLFLFHGVQDPMIPKFSKRLILDTLI